jgi:hypothetical protein
VLRLLRAHRAAGHRPTQTREPNCRVEPFAAVACSASACRAVCTNEDRHTTQSVTTEGAGHVGTARSRRVRTRSSAWRRLA